jgi:hypothetical protein
MVIYKFKIRKGHREGILFQQKVRRATARVRHSRSTSTLPGTKKLLIAGGYDATRFRNALLEKDITVHSSQKKQEKADYIR